MIQRKFGHIPDLVDHVEEDKILRPLTSVKLGGMTTPSFASNLQHVEKVRDQGSTGSCVGHAFATGIHMCARRLGTVHPFPSPLAIYTGARSRELIVLSDEQSRRIGLTDDGCRPRFAFDAITDPLLSCLVPESDWPLDERLLNERLPMDIYQKAEGLDVECYRVTGDGRARTRQIKEAVAAGMPVVFGMLLDDRYSSFDGGVYEPIGDVSGGHMQTIVGYNGDLFHVLNSWGELWNSGGLVWMHADVLGGDRAYDFFAIESGIQ